MSVRSEPKKCFPPSDRIYDAQTNPRVEIAIRSMVAARSTPGPKSVRRSATISRARSPPWSWQTVRIFGKGQLSSENAPSRRVYRSRLPGRSAGREGPDYLSLKFDDASLHRTDLRRPVRRSRRRCNLFWLWPRKNAKWQTCGPNCAHTRARTGEPAEREILAFV